MTFSTLTVEEKENYGFNVPLRDDEYKSSPLSLHTVIKY